MNSVVEYCHRHRHRWRLQWFWRLSSSCSRSQVSCAAPFHFTELCLSSNISISLKNIYISLNIPVAICKTRCWTPHVNHQVPVGLTLKQCFNSAGEVQSSNSEKQSMYNVEGGAKYNDEEKSKRCRRRERALSAPQEGPFGLQTCPG